MIFTQNTTISSFYDFFYNNNEEFVHEECSNKLIYYNNYYKFIKIFIKHSRKSKPTYEKLVIRTDLEIK